MVFSLANRGKCNSPGCPMGCLYFYLEAADPDKALPLQKCTICGCYAAQHAEENVQTAPAAPVLPSMPAAPKVSATASTLNASRPAVGPFRAQAERRNANVAHSLPAGTTFHPAKESQVQGDLNPYDSKSKKRKQMGKPVVLNPVVVKPKNNAKEYTVVLVEDTAAAAQAAYIKPGSIKLNDLADEGYMQKISISDTAAPADIIKSVTAAFAGVPEVAEHGWGLLRVKADLTSTGDLRKGKAHRLGPMKGSKEINTLNWQRSLANTSVRGAGRGFKSLIFIALNASGPNLNFAPEGNAKKMGSTIDSSDASMSSDREDSNMHKTEASDGSDSSSASMKRPFKKSKVWFPALVSPSHLPAEQATASTSEDDSGPISANQPDKGKAKANLEEDIHMKPEFSTAKARVQKTNHKDWESHETHHKGPQDKGKGKANSLGSDSEEVPLDFQFHDDPPNEMAPIPSDHLQLRRLLKNMMEPTKSVTWWLEKTPSRYRKIEGLGLLIPEWRALLDDGLMPVFKIYGFLRPRFLAHIEDILDVGTALVIGGSSVTDEETEEKFDSIFALGPGGIDVFVAIFDLIYQLISDTYHLVYDNEECIAAVAEVHGASRSLLLSLQHFRAKHDRSLWDPKGCRELAEFLKHYGDSKLPRAEMDHRMLAELKVINVRQDTRASLQFNLNDAFGDIKDSRNMLKDVLVGGPFGLQYFYEHVVSPILDSVEHEEYSGILEDVSVLCAAIVRKGMSRVKSTSKRTTAAGTNPAGEAATGSSQTDGMRTRSSGSTSHGKRNEPNAEFEFEFTPRTDRRGANDLPDADTKRDTPIEISSSDDAPPKTSTRAKRRRRASRKNGGEEAIIVTSSSESDSIPPPKKRAPSAKPKHTPAAEPKSTPAAEPKPGPEPTPSGSRAPPTAGPSGTNTRPKPRPTYGRDKWQKNWDGFFASNNLFGRAPAAAINERPGPGVDREIWDAEAIRKLKLSWTTLLRRLLHSFAASVW
ncbi:hypothetical protein B0H16DRAFT_1811285 [Mycena metata]|uniref:Uncharacterized protein n=1 Tax=Mycena metata TaxID=1033252 RepID=A0AAD7JF63_9AGAR|nr:hypothetical protein B0H16DRAFT_1811285 [Mycena metata]